MLQVTPRLITDVTGDRDDDDDGIIADADVQATNQALMAEAFAEDDVMDEFRAEIEADLDKEDEEAVANLEAQLTLPGWNSWTGPGTENLKANRTRRDRLEKMKAKRDQEKERKLKKWPLVKINEEAANASIRKLQVSDLPFPFRSKEDFEANLEPPLGKEWNPETAHQSLIEPSVQTKMGAIIKPISRELAMKKKKTASKNDKDKKRHRKRTKRQRDPEVEEATVGQDGPGKKLRKKSKDKKEEPEKRSPKKKKAISVSID